ncbi:sulfur carrier protein ThiS [Granulicella sp. 5B5]|uniref:sulfur carrier protein ThiS n=1 Tax=Granulicella sp. 5B5 TaxID=1617967 RepID=UPI0015F36EB6|nr:sulfur carrier protein ThiS [Granulicella sp. 5B5]QMV17480.1 sulfur carrier protein ThiS [Granulicella sp. 5B5]
MTTSELSLHINGRPRTFPAIASPATLADLLTALELKADRIAVELNGEIAPRTQWPTLQIRSGDKLEIVHFVGGGR